MQVMVKNAGVESAPERKPGKRAYKTLPATGTIDAARINRVYIPYTGGCLSEEIRRRSNPPAIRK